MTESEAKNVVDDPLAKRRVVGLVRFQDASGMAEAIQWVLTSPMLAGFPSGRLRTELRLEATGSSGFVKLVHFWREKPAEGGPGRTLPNSMHAVVISDNSD